MKQLTIFGGKKTRTKPFPGQPGPTECNDYAFGAINVLRSRVLSGYRGNASPAFWGGDKVQEFEKAIEDKFDIEYAVACNSATSGLWMACAAIGLQPGDEVIVTPWSMSCSATVPLLFGAIPVFADIEPEYFCLDIDDVGNKITDRTKAIIAVDLFGQPCDPNLRVLADRHDIYLIEDAAQAIGSYFENDTGKRYAGSLGHIGVYSFTQGKHLTAGEGGCCVTNDQKLARNLAVLRNHAEAVRNDSSIFFSPNNNPVGLNLRMTEIQASILLVELQRLDRYIQDRRDNVEAISTAFPEWVQLAPTRPGCSHSYYVMPMLSRDPTKNTGEIAEALRAELMPDEIRIDRGVPIANGYIKPLYLFPVFQQLTHWAFFLKENEGNSAMYKEGTCPVAERLTENGLIITLLHGLALEDADRQDVITAFQKVFSYYGD